MIRLLPEVAWGNHTMECPAARTQGGLGAGKFRRSPCRGRRNPRLVRGRLNPPATNLPPARLWKSHHRTPARWAG